jgi:hypothetical protein
VTLSRNINELRKRAVDWQIELSSPNVRSTLTVGIVSKALLAFEGALTQVASILIRHLDSSGSSHCKLLLSGKTLSRCSLGDKCTLLIGLREDFVTAFARLDKIASTEILPSSDSAALLELTRYRNKLLHGELGFEMNLDPRTVATIGSMIIKFCDSRLVRAAVSLDQQNTPSSRQA